ncbi:uncharacterized protein PSANT_02817 [Moesziomyces antarcticus]|nr:uncharacterized protein PSANT_02817 [Moesziomyces antarcticus]
MTDVAFDLSKYPLSDDDLSVFISAWAVKNAPRLLQQDTGSQPYSSTAAPAAEAVATQPRPCTPVPTSPTISAHPSPQLLPGEPSTLEPTIIDLTRSPSPPSAAPAAVSNESADNHRDGAASKKTRTPAADAASESRPRKKNRCLPKSPPILIQTFLAPPKGATSQYQGVHLKSEKEGRYWYSKAVIRVQEVPSEGGFSVDKTGSEVRAAIQYDLWRLKLLDRHMTVNFEKMRRVYIHLLVHCTEYEAVEMAYECLGGDGFARSEAARIAQEADPQPAASGSSSNPISVDSPSPPPEAGPSSRAAEGPVRGTKPELTLSKFVPAKRESP